MSQSYYLLSSKYYMLSAHPNVGVGEVPGSLISIDAS